MRIIHYFIADGVSLLLILLSNIYLQPLALSDYFRLKFLKIYYSSYRALLRKETSVNPGHSENKD